MSQLPGNHGLADTQNTQKSICRFFFTHRYICRNTDQHTPFSVPVSAVKKSPDIAGVPHHLPGQSLLMRIKQSRRGHIITVPALPDFVFYS